MKGTVRVHVNGAGANVRVVLGIYQFAASGMSETAYTNDQGDAYIRVDTDQFAEAEVYVDGQLRVRRASIRETYYV